MEDFYFDNPHFSEMQPSVQEPAKAREEKKQETTQALA